MEESLNLFLRGLSRKERLISKEQREVLMLIQHDVVRFLNSGFLLKASPRKNILSGRPNSLWYPIYYKAVFASLDLNKKMHARAFFSWLRGVHKTGGGKEDIPHLVNIMEGSIARGGLGVKSYDDIPVLFLRYGDPQRQYPANFIDFFHALKKFRNVPGKLESAVGHPLFKFNSKNLRPIARGLLDREGAYVSKKVLLKIWNTADFDGSNYARRMIVEKLEKNLKDAVHYGGHSIDNLADLIEGNSFLENTFRAARENQSLADAFQDIYVNLN